MIKNIVTLCLIAFVSFQTTAQKKLKSGLIKMEITDVKSDDEMVAAQLEMMKGTETIYAFTDKTSYSQSNMMGGLMQMTTITDVSTQATTLFMDMMGQKMLVPSSKEDRDKYNPAEQQTKWDVKYDKSDTKTIAGYKCYKANIAMDGMEGGFQMYITEDILASNEMIQGMEAMNLDGFPLEYLMEMPQMSFTYTAVEVTDKVDKSIFEVDKTGYKEMTYDEFMKQMGGMAGGLGF